MNIQRINNLINKKSKIKGGDFNDLRKILDKYPYFQTAHLLYIWTAKNTKNKNIDKIIKKSSVFISNREVLYNLLFDVSIKQKKEIVNLRPEEKDKLQNKKNVAKIIKKNPKIVKQTKTKIETIEKVDEKNVIMSSLTDDIFNKISVIQRKKQKKLPKKKTTEIKKDVPKKKLIEIRKDVSKKKTTEIRKDVPKKKLTEIRKDVSKKKLTEIKKDVPKKKLIEIKKDIPKKKTNETKKESFAANIILNKIAFFKNKKKSENVNKDNYEEQKTDEKKKSDLKKLHKKDKTKKLETKSGAANIHNLIAKYKENIKEKKVKEDEHSQKKEEILDKKIDIAKKKEPVITELMANIYISQGYYDKAIEILNKLILKYPEKNNYFATKIREAENEKLN